MGCVVTRGVYALAMRLYVTCERVESVKVNAQSRSAVAGW